MARRLLLCALLAPAAVVRGGVAQQPAAPARDNPARLQQQPATTAGIRGRVVDVTTGRALAKTKITLSSDAGIEATPVFTNGNGEFAFVPLPAGHYTLLSEKTGYARLRYGARGELDPPEEIDIRAGSSIEDLLVRLTKGAAIYGRITDDFGDPIVGGEVTLNAVQIIGSSPRLVAVSRPPVETNDLGDYRIGDLPAGRYYVSVAAAGLGTMPSGEPREWERLVAWGRTYYPGTPSQSAAAVVAVGAGDDRGGIDFSVRPFDRIRLMVNVTGLLSFAPPQPPGDLQRITPPGSVLDPPGSTAAQLNADAARLAAGAGTAFAGASGPLNINFVPADENDAGLNVRTISIGGVGSGMATFSVPASVDEGDWIVFARQGSVGAMNHVRLNSGDDTSLSIDLRPGSRVSGRVVFEGARGPLPAGTQISVHGAGDAAAVPARLYMGRPVAPRADGSFDIPDLFGTIQVDAASPPGWTVKAVTLGARDLLDEPLTLKSGENVAGVQVIFSNHVASFSGTTAFANGAPAAGCVVAVFPDASVTRLNARRMRLARAGRKGEFRFVDLPSGTYRVAAAIDIDASTWLTPESVDALRARSVPLTLTDREPQSQVLTCAVSP